MQYSLYVNQLFLASDPRFASLDLIDACIFDCIRKMITGKHSRRKEVRGENFWAHVTVKRVLEEMPMLRDSKGKPWKANTIRGRITKLVECGLLERDETNQKKGISIIGLTDLASDYDSTTYRPCDLNSKVGGKPCDVDDKVGSEPCDLYDNLTNNNTTNNILQKNPLTPLQGETQSVKEKKKRTTVRRTSTTEQSIAEYAREIDSINRLPQAVDEAAGARRTKYINLVAWMRKDGRDATVMRMGKHLSFAEYERLHLEYGMTAYQVVCYLERLHEYTDRHKNLTVFGTIRHWWQDDGKRDRRPPASPVNGHQQVQSQGTARAPINGTYDR